MALHIVKGCDKKTLLEGLDIKYQVDFENANIEQRVTRQKAGEYADMWRKILLDEQAKGTHIDALFNSSGSTMTSQLIQKDENRMLRDLKDQLFVQAGEDTDDIFAAFEHYGLPINPIK